MNGDKVWEKNSIIRALTYSLGLVLMFHGCQKVEETLSILVVKTLIWDTSLFNQLSKASRAKA